MSRSLSAACVCLLLLAGAVAPVEAAGPAKGKLHALVVFDTECSLKNELKYDIRNFSETLKCVPKNQLNATVLTGSQVTRAKVLAYFRNLEVGPNDAVLFFYGGHGARTQAGELYFQFESNPNQPFFRAELRKAMEAKKARLTVILTDCCSNVPRQPDDGPNHELPIPSSKGISDVARTLFFESKGIVDITAATNSVAYGDKEQGGLFTRTFCRLVREGDLKKLDPSGGGRVTWAKFFPVLRKETEQTFKEWKVKTERRRNQTVEATEQKPMYFALASDLGSGSAHTASPSGLVLEPVTSRLYAVLVVENKSPRAITYRYKWDGEAQWQSVTVAAGKQFRHTTVAKDKKSLPGLQVEFTGVKAPARLLAESWTGKNLSNAEGKLYVVQNKKSYERGEGLTLE